MTNAVSVIASDQFQKSFDSEQAKQKKSQSSTWVKTKWTINEQRHALLFSLGRCCAWIKSRVTEGVYMCDFLNSEHIYNRDSQDQVSVEP